MRAVVAFKPGGGAAMRAAIANATRAGAGLRNEPCAASSTPVAEQTGLFADALTPTQEATLEALRVQLIRPVVQALTASPTHCGCCSPVR